MVADQCRITDVVDFYTVKFEDAKQNAALQAGGWEPGEERIGASSCERLGGSLSQTPCAVRAGVPVVTDENQSLAVRWTAHEPSTILKQFGA